MEQKENHCPASGRNMEWVQMPRYRFHCTNGHECVFDGEGEDIRAPARLKVRARQVAQDLMWRFYDQTDWSEWHVTVHDLNGRRVLLQPFVTSADDAVALAA
jgi:hypothetical protein